MNLGSVLFRLPLVGSKSVNSVNADSLDSNSIAHLSQSLPLSHATLIPLLQSVLSGLGFGAADSFSNAKVSYQDLLQSAASCHMKNISETYCRKVCHYGCVFGTATLLMGVWPTIFFNQDITSIVQAE